MVDGFNPYGSGPTPIGVKVASTEGEKTDAGLFFSNGRDISTTGHGDGKVLNAPAEAIE